MGRTGILRPAEDNLPLAVGVIVFTVLCLSLGDAAIKLTSGQFPLWQVFVLRSVLAVPLLIVALKAMPRPPRLVPAQLPWVLLRSAMLVGMWVLYYLALPHMPLSVAAATIYTLPLFITLFAALFAGDRITPLGWGAVALGFLGVLLILRPSTADFDLHALLPLGAAMLYAGAMIMTRTTCRTEHPLVLSLWLNLCFILVGLVMTGMTGLTDREGTAGDGPDFPWSAMGTAEWLTMALLALSILVGSIGAAIAYQNGPPSVIGTFDFAYVGFASVWGFVFFKEVPDTLSAAGIALIVIAGMVAVRFSAPPKIAI